MKKYIITFLILLSVSVNAQITINGHTFADTIHITQADTGSTFSTNDRAYVLQDSIHVNLSSTGGLYFLNCDTCALISEPGNKYTIIVDSSGSGTTGMQVYASSGFTMRNIRMRANWNQTDTFYNGNQPRLAYFFLSDSAYIDSSYFYTTGYAHVDGNGNYGLTCILITGGAIPYMTDIVNDSFILDGYGFERRDQYPMMAVHALGSASLPGITTGSRSEYGLRFAHNYLKTSWNGVKYTAGSGDGVLVFDTNTVVAAWVQTSATSYLGSFVGDGGAMYVTQGIDKVFADGNTMTHIIDTTVSPKLRGGSAIFMATTRNDDLPEFPRSQISNNNIHAGGYYASDHVYCIFQKYDGGINNYDIVNNDFKTTIYNTDTNYTWGECIWMMQLENCSTAYNRYTMANYHSGTEGVAVFYRDMPSTDSAVFVGDSIFSTDWHMWLVAQTTGQGFANVDFKNYYWSRIDTMTTLDDGGIGDWHVNPVTWSPTTPLNDVSMVNTHTDGNIADTTKVWSAGYTNANSWIEWYRDFEIKVQDSLGANLNATVIVTNRHSDTLYNNLVGDDGLDSILAKYWFSTAGASDSSFNKFYFAAVYPGIDTVFDSLGIGENDSTITLTIGTEAMEAVRINELRNVILRSVTIQ